MSTRRERSRWREALSRAHRDYVLRHPTTKCYSGYWVRPRPQGRRDYHPFWLILVFFLVLAIALTVLLALQPAEPVVEPTPAPTILPSSTPTNVPVTPTPSPTASPSPSSVPAPVIEPSMACGYFYFWDLFCYHEFDYDNLGNYSWHIDIGFGIN